MQLNYTRRVALFFVFGLTIPCIILPLRAQNAMTPKLTDQSSFDVIGLETRTNNGAEMTGNGEIPKLWQRLFTEGVLNRIPDRADEAVVAVYTKYASDAAGDYTYILGAKVKAGAKAPAGMVAITIPAGKYEQFVSAKGPGAEVIPPAWKEIYSYFQAPGATPRLFKTDFERYDDMSDPNAVQAHIFIGVK
jgi:predicted transcriptional regulator YdeE